MKTSCAHSIHLFDINRLMEWLAASRPGRLALHSLCLLRHPSHSRWHWHGIMRELSHCAFAVALLLPLTLPRLVSSLAPPDLC